MDAGRVAEPPAAVPRGLRAARPLRVLFAEDSDDDVELSLRELRRGGYDVIYERMDTAAAMEAAVTRQPWDLIVVDHRMPNFDAPEALRVVTRSGVDVPCIIVSGMIDERLAIAAMEAGARDFIDKANLGRLLPAVARELRDTEIRRARQRAELALRVSEERYRELVENANDIVYTHDLAGNFTSINQAAERISGYRRQEVIGLNITQIITPEHLPLALQTIARQLAGEKPPAYEIDLITKAGRRVTVEVNTRLVYRDRQPVGVEGIARDVTERKRAQQRAGVLLEIASDISGTLDLDELINRVQRCTAAVLPCDRVATFFTDPITNTVGLRAHCGVPPDQLADLTALRFQRDQPVTRALGHGQTLVLNEMVAQSWVPAALWQRFGITALVAVPMRVHGRHLGTLVAAHAGAGRAFDADQVTLCEGIARQLAVAIDAAEMYQGQREQAEVAAALASVGRELIAVLDTPLLLDLLCRVTVDTLGCSASHVLMWRPAEDSFVEMSACHAMKGSAGVAFPKLTRAAVVDALAGDDVALLSTAAAQPLPLAALQREAGVHAALYGALRRGREIVGVLVACQSDDCAGPTPRQEQLARGIAHVASLAIENARLVEELKRADRLKSEFVATMSHELRTPLNIITGYNELLLEGVFGSLSPDQADSLQRIQKSTAELLTLVSDTLDLSRLDAGRLSLDLRTISLHSLAAELDAETREVGTRNGLYCQWRMAPDLPVLHSDPAKLKVVLKNLILNAFKFTEQGGVTVDIQPQADGIEVAVSDTGIGIAPETVAIIFEPFRQGDGSATRRFGGVGLGLHIVRRLLELLGGHVSVESTVGQGSNFRVWLPLSPNLKQAVAA